MKAQQPILLVEDDRVDVMTIRRAMREIHLTNPIFVAGNGEEALAYLRDPARERPGIILLDLNMPKMNGIEFLEVAKGDPALRSIPVVVLTTSHQEQDKLQSYNFGVAGYMLKPVDYRQFVEVIRTINLYWTLSQLPEEA